MKPFFIFILLSFNSLCIIANENYLTNPFFSKIKRYPRQTDEFDITLNWYNPTNASPDLLSKNGGDRSHLPGFVAGDVNAARGINCAGILTYKLSQQFSGNGKYGFREYISNRIKKQLVVGQEYCIQFKFLVTYGSKYKCSDLGIYFSENLPSHPDYVGPLDHITPQIECNIHPKERGIWYEFKATLIANGKERFMTIGNFKRNKESNIEKWNHMLCAHIYSNYCYLMLDNFRLNIIYPPSMIKKLPKLDYITFNFNDSINNQIDSLKFLSNYARLKLILDSNATLLIRAYSDNIGSIDDNIYICKKRSEFVLNYLIESGIPAQKLHIEYLPKFGKGRLARKVKLIALKNQSLTAYQK